MVSPKAVRQALYERLNTSSVTSLLASGSASLYHAVAPSGSPYPLVIFNKQAGTPHHQMGGSHYDDQMWLVKAIAKGGSSSTAEDIDKAIADRLDFGSLNISGGTLLYLARESDVDYVEESSGELYRHHGALYRLSLY